MVRSVKQPSSPWPQEKLKISALDIWPLDFVKDARQKLAEIMSSLTAD